jgi:pyruvate/2-oxoglutarate dehydrogenase complex dihydrolipoamide acyltransferase (E2) component
MTTKFFALICVIGIAGASIAQAQSPTPGESPAQSPTPAKHRATKKAQTTASPAGVAASPSPAGSPAASPKAKRAHKKAEAAAAASPSPGKFNLGDLFKPKTSTAAASPAAANPAPARAASTKAATAPAPGGGHGLVWVNTETHVYHKEGSRFYGTTKKGKYVSEADAIKEGDKAARN